MNNYNSFDTVVNREDMASIRQLHAGDRLKEKGFISLWGAEFEFPTAPCVTNAIIDWASKGLAAYNVMDTKLKTCIVNWMKDHRNWEISADWIVPTYGLTASVATMCRAFCKPSDGIIGFDPVYHMTWEAAEFNGVTHISCPLIYKDGNYSIDYDLFEELCKKPENKIVTVCNPHNPIAKVWGREDLIRIAEIAHKYDKIIYSDEIFADQVYEGVEMLTFDQVTDLPLKVIVSTSLGKTYSITGVGQANIIIKDKDLREEFIKQRDIDHHGSFDPMMRAAYLGGYSEEGRQWLKEMMDYLWQTYTELDEFFKANTPGIKIVKPEGTFILWLDCTGLDYKNNSEMEAVFEKAGLLCDYGTTYNSPDGFVRINIAAPRKEIMRVFKSLADEINNK